jgi:tRNA uracil 4-sulfurtransferase
MKTMERDERLILVRLAPEFSTKSRGTRYRFGRRLLANMSDALKTTGAPFKVHSEWSRIFVRSAAPEALEVLTRVPGLSSLSPVDGQSPAELDRIVRVGTELYADRVRGRTYAVRARRSGTHDFSSADVQRALGAALNPGATVDLNRPEVEVHVEVRDGSTYFFSDRMEGLGGLPLAVEARAVCLLSGGFDSAVAAWLMLKRGVEQDYVFCNLAGEAYERTVVQVGKILADEWSFGTRPRLHVVDFTAVVDDLREKTNPRYWQILLKRLMYRAADSVGDALGAAAIITGEAVGQVSSQTLQNLRVIDVSADLPVLRPLIGFDKNEIIGLSRRIGTYGISSRVKEYCAIAPGNPVTGARMDVTDHEDARLDPTVLERAVADRRVLDLRELGMADLVEPYVFTETIPEDAVILDVRSEDEWETWHYPGAEQRDLWELLAGIRKLDRDRLYVVYCGVGLQAAHLAEQMQREGLEAYAFRGGVRQLRDYSTRRGATGA